MQSGHAMRSSAMVANISAPKAHIIACTAAMIGWDILTLSPSSKAVAASVLLAVVKNL